MDYWPALGFARFPQASAPRLNGDGHASVVPREAAGIPLSLVTGRAGGLAYGLFVSLGVTVPELRHQSGRPPDDPRLA